MDLEHLVKVDGSLADGFLLHILNYDIYITGAELATLKEIVRNFIADLGQFYMFHYETVSDSDKRHVEVAVGRLFLSAM